MACPRCNFWHLEHGACECSACAAAKRLVWWASHWLLSLGQQPEVVAILNEASLSIADLVGKASVIIAGEESRARQRTGAGPEFVSNDEGTFNEEAGSGDRHGGTGDSSSARSSSHRARSRSRGRQPFNLPARRNEPPSQLPPRAPDRRRPATPERSASPPDRYHAPGSHWSDPRHEGLPRYGEAAGSYRPHSPLTRPLSPDQPPRDNRPGEDDSVGPWPPPKKWRQRGSRGGKSKRQADE